MMNDLTPSYHQSKQTMNRYSLFIILSLAAANSTTTAQAPPDSVATQIRRLRSGDVVDRSRAAKALGAMGVAAEPAVPALVQALRDENSIFVGDVVESLRRIGAPAVPALVQALDGPDAKLRHQAAVALSRIGPTDSAAFKALVKALKDPSANVRRRAALALENAGKVGTFRDGAIMGLIRALADRDGTVRISAAVALGHIGADAREAAGPLSQLLNDDDAELRAAAAEAIREINASRPPGGPR